MSIEKYEFTYDDYLNYCDSLYCNTSEELLCVREESTSYTLDENKKKTGDKKHDKIFKEILQNPKEMAEFINNFTNHRVNVDITVRTILQKILNTSRQILYTK